MAYTVVDKGSSYFNTITYTGNGSSSRNITGVGFDPNFTWIKNRTNAYSHVLSNIISGDNKFLSSNGTGAEETDSAKFRTFVTDGFQVGSHVGVNENSSSFVSWNFKANGAGVSNTSGSISSTVSANTTSGFSIVSYTGTGANATVGHGLGVAPRMIIIKTRSGVSDWGVYHESITNTKRILLNSTGASGNFTWGGSPTSSVFYVNNDGLVNGSGSTYIAYCFAEVKGFSKFGSYTGNGSTDGTFVYTGFKPAFVMFKVSSTTENWVIRDNKRDTFNNVYKQLLPNASSAEDTSNDGRFSNDFLSNGFKLRATHATTNQSGATYIYMAFADSPFVSSKAIPTTAR